jgi:hypothetical protein
MMTVIKVRDRAEQLRRRPRLVSASAGTVAMKADAAELARDGIEMGSDDVDVAPSNR